MNSLTKKIEFTKIMVAILTFIFFSFYIFSIIVWLYDGRYLNELAAYISKVFSIINSCYLVKSSIQNNVKIRKQFDPSQVRKKVTFSKIIVIIASLTFILSSVFFCIYWGIYNVFPSDLFEYIATPFITILPTYLAKTVIENYSLDNISIQDFLGKMGEYNNGVNEILSELMNKISNAVKSDEETEEEIVTNDEDIIDEQTNGEDDPEGLG